LNKEKRYPIASDRVPMKTAVNRNTDLGDVTINVLGCSLAQVDMRSNYCAFIMMEETVEKLSQNIFFIP